MANDNKYLTKRTLGAITLGEMTIIAERHNLTTKQIFHIVSDLYDSETFLSPEQSKIYLQSKKVPQ